MVKKGILHCAEGIESHLHRHTTVGIPGICMNGTSMNKT